MQLSHERSHSLHRHLEGDGLPCSTIPHDRHKLLSLYVTRSQLHTHWHTLGGGERGEGRGGEGRGGGEGREGRGEGRGEEGGRGGERGRKECMKVKMLH